MVTICPFNPIDLFRGNAAILSSSFRDREIGFYLDSMAKRPHFSLKATTLDGTVIALLLGYVPPPEDPPHVIQDDIDQPSVFDDENVTQMWGLIIDYGRYRFTHTEDCMLFVVACMSLVKRNLILEFYLDLRDAHMAFMWTGQGFIQNKELYEGKYIRFTKYLSQLKSVLPSSYYKKKGKTITYM